jgi:D-arabinose 1-dehydrogenase-like Zn-dependent alcohol dehydrogenase
MCAGVTIRTALGRAGVELREGGGRGRTIAISGAGGGLGHLGIQFAVKLGCEVVAIDAADKPLALAREVASNLGSAGKITVVDARRSPAEDVRKQVCGEPEPALEGEKGVDAVLILPESQKALEYGMKLLRNHGTCVSARDLVFRDIKLVGTLVGRNAQLRAMLNFAAKHGARAKTKSYSLERLNELVEDYHRGHGGKLVVDMTK